VPLDIEVISPAASPRDACRWFERLWLAITASEAGPLRIAPAFIGRFGNCGPCFALHMQRKGVAIDICLNNSASFDAYGICVGRPRRVHAHGAGFLAAASALDVRPELVTATSGKSWCSRKAAWRQGSEIEPDLARAGRQSAGQLQTALFGYPACSSPPIRTRCPAGSLPKFRKDFVDMIADRFLPAQQFVSDRPEKSFQEVADTFNESAGGVLFNSYDLATGKVSSTHAVAKNAMPTAKAIPNMHAAKPEASAGRS